MSQVFHIPVLLHEVIQALDPKPNEHFVDGTLGGGGHAVEILKRTAPNGRLLAIDRDETAIKRFRNTIAGTGFEDRVKCVCGNFADVAGHLKSVSFPSVSGMILDLGFSSYQLEEGRGLSFQKDEPLTMRYEAGEGETAASIVSGYSERDLADLIFQNSDERYARVIARNIVAARKKERILTTGQLARIIESSVPKGYERGRIHPATRTFLALRIEVNHEREALEKVLGDMPSIFSGGGRVAVISFQSVEDALVKKAFHAYKREGIAILPSKKPIVPSSAEVAANPRSRSAKLRVAYFK